MIPAPPEPGCTPGAACHSAERVKWKKLAARIPSWVYFNLQGHTKLSPRDDGSARTLDAVALDMARAADARIGELIGGTRFPEAS